MLGYVERTRTAQGVKQTYMHWWDGTGEAWSGRGTEEIQRRCLR
jgi:hypothetical protein